MFSNTNTDLNQKLNESINSSAPLRKLFKKNKDLKTAINNYDYSSRELSLALKCLSTPVLELLIPILKHLELETLNLNFNQLKTLPESIGDLANLVTLNLVSNRLQTLPKSIGGLTNLKTLNLFKNKLETLPDSIGGLTNLKTLNLNFNKLKILPESIGDLANLVKLNLASNRLETLPECIGDLANLVKLNLDNNLLPTLPESIGELTSLNFLSIRNNRLQTLPESIGGFNNIDIYAQNNPLSEQTIRWIMSLSAQLIIFNMAAHTLLSSMDLALDKLYPNKLQKVTAIKDSINSEEFKTSQNYNINNEISDTGASAQNVLTNFLRRFEIFNTNDTNSPMLVAARAIFNRIFDDKPLDDKKRTEISKIAISLGDCNTPVMSHLIAEFHSPHYEILKNGENIASEIDDLIAREALEYTVVNELSGRYLGGRNANEKIEKVQALVNAVYLKEAENHIENTTIKIEGNRSYLPSKSAYPVFGFKQVRDNTELVEAFLKLVCKEDDKGNLIKNENNKYKLDQVKIQVIKIRYFEKQDINTPLIKIIKDYKTQVTEFIKKMIKENQNILDFSDPKSIDMNLFDEKKQIKAFELAVFNKGIQQHDEPKIDYEKSADSFLKKLKTSLNERVHYQKNFTVFEESVASEVQGNYLDRFKSPQIKALNLEIPNQSAIRPGKKHHKKLGF
ncbi:MAG: Leucine-rich repeat (LRR) protein [Urechidicola sp.]|jgi:Leucine-rich repeat (LRR) protein